MASLTRASGERKKAYFLCNCKGILIASCFTSPQELRFYFIQMYPTKKKKLIKKRMKEKATILLLNSKNIGCFCSPEPPNRPLARVVGRFFPFAAGGSNIWNDRDENVNQTNQRQSKSLLTYVSFPSVKCAKTFIQNVLFFILPILAKSYNKHEAIWAFQQVSCIYCNPIKHELQTNTR